jgi:hypothetical protein
MRRLLILQFICTLLFSMLIGAAILIGRQQPQPEHLAMLHLTDCAAPCWIGIVPGVTTMEEAEARIKAVYGDTSKYRISAPYYDNYHIEKLDNPSQQLEILFYIYETSQNDNVEKIRNISFRFDGLPTDPTLAELISLFGSPIDVYSDYETNFTLIYKKNIQNNNISIYMPRGMIWFSNHKVSWADIPNEVIFYHLLTQTKRSK